MIIHREKVHIKHYGEFEKIVRFSKKNHLFSIDVPELLVKDKEVVQMDRALGRTWEDVNKEYYEKVREFELLHASFRTVIIYKIEKQTDRGDGSGVGLLLVWGVFKVINQGHNINDYFFVRGWGKDIHRSYHREIIKYPQMPWTEKREQFFIQLSDGVINLIEKLNYFITNLETVALPESFSINEEIKQWD